MRKPNSSFSDSVCAPPPSSSSPSPAASCLDLATLVLIARLYNQHFARVDPSVPPIKLFRSSAERQHRAISDAMASNPAVGCRPMDEVCWVSQPFARASGRVANASSRSFRPAQPASWRNNKNDWLSNEDIEAVLRQYARAGKSRIKFVGVFPIDFAEPVSAESAASCVSPEVCRLSVAEEIRRGTKHLWFVFNTDPHDEPGQHWIALYVGLDPAVKRGFGVHFYDSVAKPAPPSVAAFMRRLAIEMRRALGEGGPLAQVKVPVRQNRIRRQFKNTECGIYAMLFLLRMTALAGDGAIAASQAPIIASPSAGSGDFRKVCESMGNDQQVQIFRDRLFVRR